jgi:glycosyltransferase involved in cell wall biosynthesis
MIRTISDGPPLVSICTPTYNRKKFMKSLVNNIDSQDYPKSLIEWVIIDDGEDNLEDVIQNAREIMKEIKISYVKLSIKVALGKKRNMMHEYASGSILVYMDDDDYYPPTRISHAVEMLTQNPDISCAGCSKIYVYFTEKNETYSFGPYHTYHATANTFAFRRELLKETRYEDCAVVSEEKYFLQNYTIPMIQLNTLKTILVISHNCSTFDKRQILKHATKSKNSFKHFTKCGFILESYL